MDGAQLEDGVAGSIGTGSRRRGTSHPGSAPGRRSVDRAPRDQQGRSGARPERARFEGLPVRVLGLIAWIALATATSACLSPQVHVDTSDPVALRDATAIEVRLAPTKAGAAPVVPEATAEAFLDRVRAELRAGAHPILGEAEGSGGAGGVGDAAGHVVLELAVVEQPVTRRTYTADTDANGTRLEERTEAIVVLRALGADGRTEIWRCTARSLLPKPDAPFGPTGDEVFEGLLERALERIPKRS